MKKKRVVRKHIVKATIHVQELSKAGTSIEFQISASGEKIGTITIGRGSLIWRGGRRRRAKAISWSRFAEEMDRWVYGES